MSHSGPQRPLQTRQERVRELIEAREGGDIARLGVRGLKARHNKEFRSLELGFQSHPYPRPHETVLKTLQNLCRRANSPSGSRISTNQHSNDKLLEFCYLRQVNDL